MDLEQGLSELGLDAEPHQVVQLETVLDMVLKWNKVYNLTRIVDRKHMVSHHLLDSLAIAAYLSDEPLLDVGSGAGFPGLPLAIMRPFHDITVLDSAQKRTRFCTQLKGQLELSNLSVETARVESFKPGYEFEQITARAFAPLQDICVWTAHLRSKNCRILAMKGQYPSEEIDKTHELFPKAQVDSIELEVPGVDAQRHLITVQF